MVRMWVHFWNSKRLRVGSRSSLRNSEERMVLWVMKPFYEINSNLSLASSSMNLENGVGSSSGWVSGCALAELFLFPLRWAVCTSVRTSDLVLNDFLVKGSAVCYSSTVCSAVCSTEDSAVGRFFLADCFLFPLRVSVSFLGISWWRARQF